MARRTPRAMHAFTVASPKGAAGEVEQGPHRYDGDATRARTQGAADRHDRLQGRISSETLGPLLRPPAAPAPRSGAPADAGTTAAKPARGPIARAALGHWTPAPWLEPF